MTERTKTRAADVGTLPALMDTGEFAELVGYGRAYVSVMCRRGKIPATKVGREWRIPTRRALERLGIEE
jgi:excisionase family DNA binding protein